MTRHCSNPSCRAEITACFGTTKAGDVIEGQDSIRTREEVRELCAYCATKTMLDLTGASNERRLSYFATIGWG